MMTNVSHYGDIEVEEQYKTIAGILIDDTLENFTWSETVSKFPWCSGSGSKEDPYIIEKVYIDGQFIGKNYLYYSNILIRHSRMHFVINSCSLHRTGVYADWNAGIFLYNTTNGVLVNNDFTYNNAGIQLFESHNNIISNNDIQSNHDAEVGLGAGICLEGYGNGNGSCNNTLNDNKIINHYSGILVYYSLNDSINRNFVSNTLFGHFPDTGIYIVDTNYSRITYNTFAGDYADYPNPYGDFIINEQNCIGNNISDNFENLYSSAAISMFTAQETSSWFSLENSNYNYIYGNVLLKTGPNPMISGYFTSLLILSVLVGITTLVWFFNSVKKKFICKL